MRHPAELHQTSGRPYRGLTPLGYPFHDGKAAVTRCGRLCLGKRKINLSLAFAGEDVGI
jgi:putative transposase